MSDTVELTVGARKRLKGQPVQLEYVASVYGHRRRSDVLVGNIVTDIAAHSLISLLRQK